MTELKLMANPLNWWQIHENEFPRISRLAKKYLCIPASSATSERTFSKSGQLISKLRSRLNPSLVDKIVFLNRNMRK